MDFQRVTERLMEAFDIKAEREMRAFAASDEVREDLRRLAVRERPMSTDEWLEFLAAYNEFIGHRPKPFRPIEGEKWLL